jgi:tetratricopeptide (TPR) repeat protein
MSHPDVSEDVWCSAALQDLALMSDIGKENEAAKQYDKLLAENPSDHRYYLLCATAHHSIEDNERALMIALDGIAHFPDKAILYCCAGDIAKTLKQYDTAFTYWRKTLELDPDMQAAAYSTGFCYEELGQYDKAYRVWSDITKELDRRGRALFFILRFFFFVKFRHSFPRKIAGPI